MAEPGEQRRHIVVGPSGRAETFTSPRGGGGGGDPNPEPDRAAHAAGLLTQVTAVQTAMVALAQTNVELRVTLSYFIEPNPARRGWKSRFVYPSHQLRFDVCRPQETLEKFRTRVNKRARDEGYKGSKDSDSRWDLGPTLRHKGSIHQDTWRGTAADLATRGVLAVYPATGWWKTRPAMKRWDRTVKYALVVSIRTPEVAADVDIYAAVENLVSIPVET